MSRTAYRVTIYLPPPRTALEYVDVSDFSQGTCSLEFKDPDSKKHIIISGLPFVMEEESPRKGLEGAVLATS
jgi:hypothetical protein